MKKKKFSVIGKPLRKIDAMAKCAGETVFADDLDYCRDHLAQYKYPRRVQILPELPKGPTGKLESVLVGESEQ